MIDLITVCYNCEDSIMRTVQSVKNQKNCAFNYYIIDGNSTDHTIDVAKSTGLPFVCISEPDTGVYDALNKGIHVSRSDIIGFLHSDDVFFDDFVLQSVEKKFTETDCDLVYGDLLYVNGSGEIIRTWESGLFTKKKLKFGWMPPHPTVFMKRSLYERYGNYNTKYKISGDYDLLVRILSSNNVKVEYMHKVLITMTTGGISNRNISSILRKSYEDLLIIKRNRLGGFLTLVCKNILKLNQFIKKPQISTGAA